MMRLDGREGRRVRKKWKRVDESDRNDKKR